MNYIDQLTAMHMNVQKGHASPHKAVMLLSVIDLIAGGDAPDNRFRLSPELMEHFRRYFDAVKTDADSCTPLNPFFYMRSESFWHHRATPGNEAVCAALSSPGGRKKLGEIIEMIFPCSDNRWHVRKDIDDRIDAHRDLINLDGKTILPPEQRQYAPKRDALLWREQRLKAG